MEQPLVFVIFGATGDLIATKLMPALYGIYRSSIVGRGMTVIGVSRREITEAQFRDSMKAAVRKRAGNTFDEALWDQFAGNISYVRGLFEDAGLYAKIADRLTQYDKKIGACIPRFFYLATPPSNYETILKNLKSSTLSEGCGQGTTEFTRVLIEKPFGRDLTTAEHLEHLLSEIFEERQIYRIDHYLGMETVQNILAFRFANGIFEPTWNKDFIDHVQINFAESIGVEGRGAFYDGVGALRDVGQNHMFEMLSLMAMEQPATFTSEAIRDRKAEVLQKVKCIDKTCVATETVRGQYVGYTKEPEVVPDSQTETFAAFRIFVDTPRWQGVPFYLRTGKKMTTKDVEISIHYKKPECGEQACAFHPASLERNILSLRIQPQEGVALHLMAKAPGYGMQIAPVTMSWDYKTSFGGGYVLLDAYERLLVDAIHGDQTLFARTDGVLASWKLITGILEAWSEMKTPVIPYQPGSMGPKESDNLPKKDGREWYLHIE